MGSPLGPTLANVFLCYNEKKWLEDCPAQFKPSYYRRYVDDIFVLLPDASHLEKFRAYMSQQHPNINLTSEEETTSRCPSSMYTSYATTTNTSPPCTGNQHTVVYIPITTASYPPVTSTALCLHCYTVPSPSAVAGTVYTRSLKTLNLS